ncbi:dipeptidyl-peptidase 10 [Syntrophothermus lipocalidus DSM 12680]|uniref:Dipeptidyl-peptidase 10 n=1 Tax=Syntrophothermus lipocalidus (strain DSM 12680 / TGB-C1) TaxID=643648 RepID=D7CIT5_SYNLT|nr:dipeptidyl-peptidase 10 [Syntrophothermus lipocalidus DSM 12680]
MHGCRIPSGPLRTEESRCVVGEESWSELANTPPQSHFHSLVVTRMRVIKVCVILRLSII